MFFFFKQKTAYEVRISDWCSDVCSSDLMRAKAGLTWSQSAGSACRPMASVMALNCAACGAALSAVAAGSNSTLKNGSESTTTIRPTASGCRRDRNSGVSGKSVSVRVDLGGRRILKKNNDKNQLR